MSQLAGFREIFDELMRFAVQHFVAALHGEQRERFGTMTLAGTSGSTHAIPVLTPYWQGGRTFLCEAGAISCVRSSRAACRAAVWTFRDTRRLG